MIRAERSMAFLGRISYHKGYRVNARSALKESLRGIATASGS